MAHDYLFFIDFVNDIAKRYGIDSPAEIEMGYSCSVTKKKTGLKSHNTL